MGGASPPIAGHAPPRDPGGKHSQGSPCMHADRIKKTAWHRNPFLNSRYLCCHLEPGCVAILRGHGASELDEPPQGASGSTGRPPGSTSPRTRSIGTCQGVISRNKAL